MRSRIAWLSALLLAPCAFAQDLVVYDDALRNDFANFSYGGGTDLGHATTVRAGTNSIAFTGNNFNAVALARPGPADVTTAQYPSLRFFVHGGAAGGQQLRLIVQRNSETASTEIVQGELDAYVAGGAIAAGAWREVVVPLAAFGVTGGFDRIDLQSDVAGVQPVLYLDDVVLVAPPSGPDPIFASGFEDFAGSPGTLRFTAAAASVSEAGGSAMASVERVGGSSGAASVVVASANGTAVAPGDYTAISTTLSWADGEAGAKSVPVPIANDAADEPDEAFTLSLANAVGATVAAPSMQAVTITDDDDAPAATMLTAERDVTVSGRTSDRYRWFDASGQPRSAALAHNTTPGGGSMREFTYRVANTTRTVGVTDNAFSVGRNGGFGYIVSHLENYDFNTGMIPNCTGQVPVESPLGFGFAGQFSRLSTGRHHAIHRYTLSYPLYGCANEGGPVTLYPMAVTIDWFFATGRNHPVWAVTLDLSSAPANAVRADSRSPYGELLFDGSATSAQHAQISGVSWGDGRLFTTTTSPVTYNSAWMWNGANTVPFVKLWTAAPDATMGIVQTQTKAQHDAGGYFGAGRWDTTSAAGPACTPAIGGTTTTMPCNFNWPYQSINYELDPFGAPNASTNQSRLAWGTNYGAIGRDLYYVHGSAFFGGPNPDTFAVGHPKQSYSTFIVLGAHTGDPVGGQVAEVEAVQQTLFTATAGTVRTQGPAGPGREGENATYAPAGWDHVYGVWTVETNTNAATVNFNIGGGRTLRNPIVNVRNWNGTTLPATVTLNGVPLVQDADYYPSIVDDANELLITLNRTLAGASNTLAVAQ